MILLRIFCHVRPVTFDGIVDVINGDLRLSCRVVDGTKGQSTSIIVPNEQITVGEFTDITGCSNVVDLQTLCEKNGCKSIQTSSA